MDVVRSEARVRSQQNSPIPRRQLGSLSVNQRSYSRASSSKGMFGDESPLLSPLPYYPRRRSVTFSGADEGREERPHYGGVYSASAPVSPVRRASPPPVGILKRPSAAAAAAGATEEEEGARPRAAGAELTHDAAAATATATSRGYGRGSARSSPVPAHRGRSTSRQRLAARRREAQLHHSFYDDSFVEEFVLSSKAELEREEEERRLAARVAAEEERARRAEKRMMVAEEKIDILQHAREVLVAAIKRRRSVSPTPTPSPARVATGRVEGPSRSSVAIATAKEADLLKSLEEDSDPDIQSALTELSRVAAKSGAARRTGRDSRQRRSVPIASDCAMLPGGTSTSDNEVGEDCDDIAYAAAQRRKRAKIERVIADILSQQEKRGKSKSKRSVVVIDWSDADDEGEDAQPPRAASAARRPRPPTRSRSVALTSEATVLPARSGRKAPSSRRAASARKRNASAAPDLGDSVLFENEDDQPILLPRRQPRRPTTTRSLSALSDAVDSRLVSDGAGAVGRVARRPPRPTRRAAAPRVPPAPTVEDVDNIDSGYADSDAARTVNPQRAAPAVHRRRTTVDQSRGLPKVSPDDPMSVFFDAAFPSPSKFDEMMQQAGGLPESRRGAGNRGRQPNLVLPSSIGRRR